MTINRDHLLEIHYRRKAESGDRFSMHKLGSILEVRGAIDSKTGAEYWYRRAAELGSEVGQEKLVGLLSRNYPVLKDVGSEQTVISNPWSINSSSVITDQSEKKEIKSVELEDVYKLERFKFENHDLIRATKGLALLVDREYWIILKLTYGGVVAICDGVERSYSFGDLFLTEGQRFGVLVPPKRDDPNDASILLEDRVRKICLDLSSNKQILEDPITLKSIREVSIRLSNDLETVKSNFEHLPSSAKIASAVMGVITLGPENCGYPTDSIQLSKLYVAKKLDWLGINWPMVLIGKWLDASFSSSQAKEILKLQSNPELVQKWIDFKAMDTHARDLSFEYLRKWIATGLQPEICLEFSDRNVDPTNALAAISQYGMDPNEAELWLRHGFELSQVRGWQGFSIDVASASKWSQIGCSPKVAFDWISASLSPETYLAWEKTTTDFVLVRLCIDNQIAPKTLDQWALFQPYFSSVNEVVEWINAGITLEDAKRWILSGVSAKIAKTWIFTDRPGIFKFGQHDIIWARELFTYQVALEWTGLSVRLEDAKNARLSNFSATEYAKWFNWKFEPLQSFNQIKAWAQEGFTPQEVDNWLKVGVRSIEVACKIRAAGFSGATMNIYQNLLKEKHQSQRSLISSQRLTEVANASDTDKRGYSSTMSDRWIKENAQLATREWLTEIIDRAEFMKKYLRKSIDKKVSLELVDSVVLSVELSGNMVTGHLESRRKLVTVKFDLDFLETIKPIKGSEECLTFGLALSWFIDLSIVLKSVRPSTDIFMMKPLGTTSTNTNSSSVGVRYVPTPHFYSAQESIRKGEGVKKVIHSVAGHLRTLSYGMKPSGEARNRAPKYLRSQMKGNETFVRPHNRGEDEDRRAYEIRLSEYSACAHALIELKAGWTQISVD